jgi:hypothetical protein
MISQLSAKLENIDTKLQDLEKQPQSKTNVKMINQYKEMKKQYEDMRDDKSIKSLFTAKNPEVPLLKKIVKLTDETNGLLSKKKEPPAPVVAQAPTPTPSASPTPPSPTVSKSKAPAPAPAEPAKQQTPMPTAPAKTQKMQLQAPKPVSELLKSGAQSKPTNTEPKSTAVSSTAQATATAPTPAPKEPAKSTIASKAASISDAFANNTAQVKVPKMQLMSTPVPIGKLKEAQDRKKDLELKEALAKRNPELESGAQQKQTTEAKADANNKTVPQKPKGP